MKEKIKQYKELLKGEGSITLQKSEVLHILLELEKLYDKVDKQLQLIEEMEPYACCM